MNRPIDIGTDRREKTKQAGRRRSPPHAPPNRVEERGDDERDDDR